MTVGKGNDIVLHISVVGIRSRITVRVGNGDLLIVAVVGCYDRLAVSIDRFEQVAVLVIFIRSDLVICICLGNNLTNRIVGISCGMVQGVGLRFEQTALIRIDDGILAADFLGGRHTVCIVGIDRYGTANIGVLSHLITAVIHEGFFGNDAVNCGITNSCYVTLCIVGEVGRITVSVGYLCRLVKAVVDLDYRITLRIGLLYNIVSVIILVGLNVSVFVGMLDQQTIAIVYTAAGLAVSVGSNSGITLTAFAGIIAVIEVRGVIQSILLSQHSTVIVIGVLEVTDTLGVRAGNNSLVLIILISERVAVYVLDGSEQIARVGENGFTLCVIVYANYLAGGILFQVHFLAGYAVSDSD